MSDSNNKGKTWAANVRRLNKDGWNATLVREVEGLSNDQWDAEAIRLGQALDVLRVVAPGAAIKAQQLNDKFCEEANPAAAVFLARGVVLLGELMRVGARAKSLASSKPPGIGVKSGNTKKGAGDACLWHTTAGAGVRAAIETGDAQAAIAVLIAAHKPDRWMGEALTEAARMDQVAIAKAILMAWEKPKPAGAVRVAMELAGPEMVALLVEWWQRCEPTSFQPFARWRSSPKPPPENMLGRVFGVEQIDGLVLAAAQRGERERVAWLKAYASAEGRKVAEAALDGSASPATALPRRPRP